MASEGDAAQTTAAFHRSVRKYHIEAPAADVWRLYTTTPMHRLLPSVWTKWTLTPYQVLCPDGKMVRVSQAWPSLRPGLQIQGFLSWGVTKIHQDLDVVEIVPLERIAFRYAPRGPAQGDQVIELSEAGTPERPSVDIAHSSHYRAKNPLYASLYNFVHSELLDAWHLGGRYYLESRRWAAAYCSPGGRLDSTSPYARLYERTLSEVVPAARPNVAEAFCLYSRRFLGASSEVPKDEEHVARWVAGLANALAEDAASARASFERDAAADDAAVKAGEAVCGRT